MGMAGGVVVPGGADLNHSRMRFVSIEPAAVAVAARCSSS